MTCNPLDTLLPQVQIPVRMIWICKCGCFSAILRYIGGSTLANGRFCYITANNNGRKSPYDWNKSAAMHTNQMAENKKVELIIILSRLMMFMNMQRCMETPMKVWKWGQIRNLTYLSFFLCLGISTSVLLLLLKRLVHLNVWYYLGLSQSCP